MKYLITNVVSLETLKDLEYEGESVRVVRAGVTSDKGGRIDAQVRDATVKKVNPYDFPDISHSILKAVAQFDPDVDIDTLSATEFNYLYYGVGGHFKPHKDVIKSDNPRLYTTITMIRKSPDLVGGALRVWNDDKSIHSINLRVGMTLVFDSSRLHQVTPVEQGEREVLVVWVNKKDQYVTK